MEDSPPNQIDPGDYCPLTMGAQVLSGPWTLEILRELLTGSSRFSDLARGVPGVSRSLLSARLKRLGDAGLLIKDESGRYRLTEAGIALGSIVRGVAEWSNRWLTPDIGLVGASVDFVMWDLRRRARRVPQMDETCVIRFAFTGAPEGKDQHWLVFDKRGIDLCYIDPCFEVDLHVETEFCDFAAVWRGETRLSDMIDSECIVLHGSKVLARAAPQWLGLPST
jgi:DNA-binding HxlR family transcriptional regulator